MAAGFKYVQTREVKTGVLLKDSQFNIASILVTDKISSLYVTGVTKTMCKVH